MANPCLRCRGSLEPIHRGGKIQFYFCRVCRIPHDGEGRAAVDLKRLNSSFNPLTLARGTIGKGSSEMSSIARTALEILLIQSLHEAYSAGLKDGVLLAYSQDVGDSAPVGGQDESLSGPSGGTGKN